jgi:hypothetical protein
VVMVAGTPRRLSARHWQIFTLLYDHRGVSSTPIASMPSFIAGPESDRWRTILSENMCAPSAGCSEDRATSSRITAA